MDDTDPGAESDLRRRAAWMLGMLAVVAVLLVVVLSAVLGSSKGNHNGTGPAPLDSAVNGAPSGHPASRSSSTPTGSSTPATNPPATGATSCPTQQRCVLAGDAGGAIGAINAYRTQHGEPAVPGAISSAAQQCALHNGSGCSGSWAESQVPKLDGTAAAQKVRTLGDLLDPKMTSFGIGWAYDPGSKQYFFAIVRQG